MKTKHLFLSATLALSAMLCTLPAEAKESHDADRDGDLEHFHHESYSHSFVDPNYHENENEGTAGISKASRHKEHRRYGRPDSGTSFAFGGHRHEHR